MTELAQNAAPAGVGDLKAWIAPNRTALCVIDIQVDFAAPDGLLAGFGVDMSAVLRTDAYPTGFYMGILGTLIAVPALFVPS